MVSDDAIADKLEELRNRIETGNADSPLKDGDNPIWVLDEAIKRLSSDIHCPHCGNALEDSAESYDHIAHGRGCTAQ